MIVGCGIDIIEIDRISDVINVNSNFLRRVFSEPEVEYIREKRSNINTIAGLFAAKEAISKALGSGIRNFKWSDIEIYHDDLGKPLVKLKNNAEIIAIEKEIGTIHVSITHDKDKAAAIAIAEDSKLIRSYSREALLAKEHNGIVIDNKFVAECLPKRERDTHKGKYGRVGIIAGSRGMTGAPALAAMASLRSGSGFVYSLVPSSISSVLEIKLTEAIIMPIEDMSRGHFTKDSINHILEILNKYDCIAVGPGMGVDDARIEMTKSIVLNSCKPIVLDADGLNCISKDTGVLRDRKVDIVITPHPGELSRLLNIDIDEIQSNRVKYCSLASEKFGVITVLKGSNTVISDPNGNVYLSIVGNPGMATAGCGDVLTGVISSLIGQGVVPLKAAIAGVYLHGLAGDIAAEDKGEYGMLASDIVDSIPYAIKYIQKNK